MELKNQAQREKSQFHIHTGIDILSQVYYFIKHENQSIYLNEINSMIRSLNIIYICNTNYCEQNSNTQRIQTHNEELPAQINI